jgi:hypothetical protein
LPPTSSQLCAGGAVDCRRHVQQEGREEQEADQAADDHGRARGIGAGVVALQLDRRQRGRGHAVRQQARAGDIAAVGLQDLFELAPLRAAFGRRIEP